MESFLFSINATMPVFAVMLLGYVLNKLGIINESFANVANKLVFKVCLPCLLFQDIAGTNIRQNFDGVYVGFCAAVTLISIIVIWIGARIFCREKAMIGAFVQAAYRSSAAILGIAFIQNIYGSSGMAPLMIIGAVPLYNVAAVVVLTFEDPAQENAGRKIWTATVNVLKNHVIIGIFLGMAASFFQLDFPAIVDKTVSSFAVMTSPLALLAIGATFEGKKAIKKIKPTCVAALIKLVGLAGVFLPVAVWFGFRDQKLLSIIVMLASPTTPTAYIMAKSMNGDDVLSSSTIALTTVLSTITLTGWIFLMRYCGWIQ